MNITRGALYKNRNAPATDAADKYLVRLCEDSGLLHKQANILIVGERYGGVVLPIREDSKPTTDLSITVVQQFYTEYVGLKNNAAANDIEEDWKTITESTFLRQGAGCEFDLVLWRIPRNKELVHAQADCIARHCHGKTLVYGVSMIKYTLPDFRELIKEYFGHIRTLAMKSKAIAFEMALPKKRGELPSYTGMLNTHGMGFLTTFPSVFSRNGIDLGTKELLRRIKLNPERKRIADVGCGYGVIGVYLHQLHPNAEITLVDSHFLSVASAKLNVPFPNVRVVAGDFLFEEKETFDAIVCNVPFHDGNLLDRTVAERCLGSVFTRIQPGGEVWLVANAGNSVSKFFPNNLTKKECHTVHKYEVWHLEI